MVRLLLGGSPCTYWSIAQKNNRETEAAGLGWELFKNYLIAKEKFSPDLFLYENNKSAAEPIKAQIRQALNVWDGTFLMPDSGGRYIEIDSALVSAQHRQRFYVHNCGEVQQPADRGILLKDILEPFTLPAENIGELDTVQKALPGLAEKLGYIPEMFNAYNISEITTKAPTLSTGSMATSSCAVNKFEKTNAIPVNATADGKAQALRASFYKDGLRNLIGNATDRRTCAAIPISHPKGSEIIAPLYEVAGGLVTIKGKQYPIKLADGFYIIRKLTVAECCRLQTLPDDYCRAVSNTQAYKGIGNGWTAEVIIHILANAFKGVPRSEKIAVLSMYDGIGTGRYCLEKLGFHNVEYHAYEIDKYAMQISASNYPDIIQHGDAFALRGAGWKL